MNVEIGIYGLVALVILLALRLPVAITLISVSLVGMTSMFGWDTSISMLSSVPYDFLARWTLSAIPMFLMMGFICYHTGLTAGLFKAAKVFFRWLPGGLAVSGILGSTGFAAVSGSSVACAASMGRIAIPEMIKSGYKPSFACGSIAAGGTIGALIPPSILMIVYGVFAQVSITKLFIGGISVGLLTALGYIITVVLVSIFRPDIAPRVSTDVDDIGVLEAFKEILPTTCLGVFIFGGMFSGLFTATEAGAVGVIGAILISLAMRKLTIQAFKESMIDTLGTTASLLIIGVGASMFTVFLSLSGLSSSILGFVNTWDPSYLQLMFMLVIIYLVLGLFMEPFGAMLVTLPMFLPILQGMDINLIWFGIFLVKMLEMGMVTPPVGMNIFVIKGVVGDAVSLTDIFKGVLVFLIYDLLLVALIVLVPSVVLFIW